MKFFPPSQDHQIQTEVHNFKQMGLETYLKIWERFKNLFRKCPNLDISKQVHVYYYGLHPKFYNMTDASTDSSVMK